MGMISVFKFIYGCPPKPPPILPTLYLCLPSSADLFENVPTELTARLTAIFKLKLIFLNPFLGSEFIDKWSQSVPPPPLL